jgi:hypothetical protein
MANQPYTESPSVADAKPGERTAENLKESTRESATGILIGSPTRGASALPKRHSHRVPQKKCERSRLDVRRPGLHNLS